MSTKDISFSAGVPNKSTHNIGLSNRTHSLDLRGQAALKIAPDTPQISATQRVHSGRGTGRYTTIHVPSVTQSTAHRAWEAGYQSPFAQVSHHPLDSLYSNAQTRQVSHPFDSPPNTSPEAQSKSSSAPNEDVVFRQTPNPLFNLPSLPSAINTSVSAHPKSAIARRATSYRPRARKIITNEITLDDIDVTAMVTLGLSPFMVGQDMIANQNRFVRNECAFARHFLRLQRAASDADSHHAQTERDIYKHLEHHKSALDMLSRGCGPTTLASGLTDPRSARHDPDFLALEKAHQETRARLEALSLQVTESFQSTQRALTDLVGRLDQIIRTGATYSDFITRSPAAITPLSPFLSSTSTSKKWASSGDSILESPSTMPPPTPDFSNRPWS